MKWYLRIFALYICNFLPLDIFKNVLGLLVVSKYMQSIRKSPFFIRREDLWSSVMSKHKNSKILFLEFGVHKGYSIQEFAKFNFHPDSRFVGFDSFEGLPMSWRNFIKIYPKNHFDVLGVIPKVEDNRITFKKGWFNKTLPKFIKDINLSEFESVVIHLDADIYSSTLFALEHIARFCKKFEVVFDELPGEEARALEDFLDVEGGRIAFIGYASANKHFPMQVALFFEGSS